MSVGAGRNLSLTHQMVIVFRIVSGQEGEDIVPQFGVNITQRNGISESHPRWRPYHKGCLPKVGWSLNKDLVFPNRFEISSPWRRRNFWIAERLSYRSRKYLDFKTPVMVFSQPSLGYAWHLDPRHHRFSRKGELSMITRTFFLSIIISGYGILDKRLPTVRLYYIFLLTKERAMLSKTVTHPKRW